MNPHDNQDHFLQIPVKIGSLVVGQCRAVRCKIPYAHGRTIQNLENTAQARLVFMIQAGVLIFQSDQLTRRRSWLYRVYA